VVRTEYSDRNASCGHILLAQDITPITCALTVHTQFKCSSCPSFCCS
jgi:hypothetical protein